MDDMLFFIYLHFMWALWVADRLLWLPLTTKSRHKTIKRGHGCASATPYGIKHNALIKYDIELLRNGFAEI